MDEGLWEHEGTEISEYYPGAFPLASPGGLPYGGWRVTMDPIPPAEDLYQVICDLNADAAVEVGYRGRISHIDSSASFGTDDITEGLRGLLISQRPYLVEVRYPDRLAGPAGPVHPKARLIAPEISLRYYPTHPHLSVDVAGDSWACPIFPQSTQWSWSEGATRTYLEHVALWLFKTEVWSRTSDILGRGGVWLGSAVPHRPSYVLAATSPEGQCRCGSGRKYAICHRLGDQLMFDAEILAGRPSDPNLELWLRRISQAPRQV